MAQPSTPHTIAPEVRNPVLSLPACSRLQALPPEARDALRAVLLDLAKDAAARADKAWRTHKGPMAMYWRAVAVYARHIARACKEAHHGAA